MDKEISVAVPSESSSLWPPLALPLLLCASRGKTKLRVATLSCCCGLCVIQIQVLPFNVFSTNKVDSGSNAEVGSILPF